MTYEEIYKIVEDHGLWLRTSGTEGKRADFSGLDLSYAELSRANLESANFSEACLLRANFKGACLDGADLSGACLRWANLRGADLISAKLIDADLSRADLRGANILGSDLYGANLIGADLRGADLTWVDLRGTNILGADFCGADLRSARSILDEQFDQIFPLQCPSTGSFIGWKKAIDKSGDEYIVKLLIPEDAKRSSGMGRKCRCSKAKTLSIQELDGTDSCLEEVNSRYDRKFVYRVGEYVEVSDFDEDRKNACSAGIHFFITRNEAVDYLLL